MLLILPLAAFLLLWVALAALGVGSDGVDMDRARPSFLAAASFWGAFLALTTEVLSLGHWLTVPWLAGVWSAGTLAAGLAAWQTGGFDKLRGSLQDLPAKYLSSPAKWGYAIAGLLVGALLVVAWISPPNNNDSLLYHMSRVAHWQQNASLANYPTAYSLQLWAQIGAETAILQFKLLLGSDHASNLVQWFSMLGCLIGVGAIANLLGSRKKGAWLAVVFLFSLPLGILESTSTQNDYVAAFWLVAFAYFVVLSKQRSLTGLEWMSMAVALGLGMLTKATIYIYAFPLAAWLLLPDLVQGNRLKAVLSAVGISLSILILNLGYWLRNMIAFGGPFGSSGWAQSRLATSWPGQILVGPMRQALLNAATPSVWLTQTIVNIEKSIEQVLGIPKSPFSLTWAWNNEDYAGNPLHVLLVAASILIVVWLWRRSQTRLPSGLVVQFALVSGFSFLLFSWLSYFAAQNVRYQVPAFALFAPLVGVAGEAVLPRRWTLALIGALALLSTPWVFFNQSRPILGWRPRTRVNSIFTESRQRLLFANWPELQEPYTEAAGLVGAASCQQVGLVIDSHDKEYLLWSVLGAPENGRRLEVLDPLSASARYLDPAFEPCAVVCTICGEDRTEWGGLPLAGDFGAARVYLRPN